MLPINRGIIALCIIVSSGINAMVDLKSIQSHEFNTIILHHSDDSGFSIENAKGFMPIQRCYMDKELRGISSERLCRLLTAGAYLAVNKLDNSDDHTLRLKARLNGGGPIIGGFLYWLTKGVGYGVPLAVGAATAQHHLKPLADQGGTSCGLATGAGHLAAVGASKAAHTMATQNVVYGFSNAPRVLTPEMMLHLADSGIAHDVGQFATQISPDALKAARAAAEAAADAALKAGEITAAVSSGAAPAVIAGMGAGKAMINAVGLDKAGQFVASGITLGATQYVSSVEAAAVAAYAFGMAIPFW